MTVKPFHVEKSDFEPSHPKLNSLLPWQLGDAGFATCPFGAWCGGPTPEFFSGKRASSYDQTPTPSWSARTAAQPSCTRSSPGHFATPRTWSSHEHPRWGRSGLMQCLDSKVATCVSKVFEYPCLNLRAAEDTCIVSSGVFVILLHEGSLQLHLNHAVTSPNLFDEPDQCLHAGDTTHALLPLV